MIKKSKNTVVWVERENNLQICADKLVKSLELWYISYINAILSKQTKNELHRLRSLHLLSQVDTKHSQ